MEIVFFNQVETTFNISLCGYNNLSPKKHARKTVLSDKKNFERFQI